MNVELRQFQQIAVDDLRVKVALALGNYNMMHIPQVVSLQAPTGSGKTIIVSALMEEIMFGTERFAEQPDAIFVWLSDSPALNEQSRQKIIAKADRIRPGACITVEDSSFDQETFSDGYIYFLNTQKIGKAGNLTQHGDGRTYTIWETIENTIKSKSDRLYFIIDEAHRGMQGREAGVATSIMQRFIKGDSRLKLSPSPVIIGMSATAARFNKLVSDTTSTINKVIVTAADVRASGLLKDRIIITYPDNPEIHNDMSVLQAASDEWKNKSEHWYMYCTEQHYAHVYPIMVIQVKAGSGEELSDTDLDDVIAKIEERCGITFKEGEVVHTFGSYGTIQLNGLSVPHVNPEEINDDRRIRIVLFKENLSTGWDCPRAETMMSFRRAEDATYISQLLGRMVRTPLGNSVNVDDSLNDVRLFLPYFNRETVSSIVNELQNTEGEDIPTVVDSESIEAAVYTTWTTRPTHRKRIPKQLPGQMSISDLLVENQMSSQTKVKNSFDTISDDEQNSPQPRMAEILGGYDPSSSMETCASEDNTHSVSLPRPVFASPRLIETTNPAEPDFVYNQMEITMSIDREAVTKFINEQALISYVVRQQRTYSFLKSLLDLASLLTITNIYREASESVKQDVAEMIHSYIERLKVGGTYDSKAKNVLKFKLLIDVFDVFGNSIKDYVQSSIFDTADSDLDRQLRAAELRLGGYGFCSYYGNKYMDEENPSAYKIDCIIFAA
ncbi:MAG: DEAD/DEAH box helicase family protein, partial [Clostridiales bacterium]|nr:DEAD/DEAH box helicase family protein [Clostridiales bacterium]